MASGRLENRSPLPGEGRIYKPSSFLRWNWILIQILPEATGRQALAAFKAKTASATRAGYTQTAAVVTSASKHSGGQGCKVMRGDYIWKVTKVNWKHMGPERQQEVTVGTSERKLSIRCQTFHLHVHLLEQIASDWLDGLQTQSLDVGGSIISTQCRQVDKGDGL